MIKDRDKAKASHNGWDLMLSGRNFGKAFFRRLTDEEFEQVRHTSCTVGVNRGRWAREKRKRDATRRAMEESK